MVELCQNFWQAERRKRDSKIRSTVCRFVIKIASAPFVKVGKRKLSKNCGVCGAQFATKSTGGVEICAPEK
jgi:hypothetical protein